MNHEFFMQRCLELARNGLGNVAPNPLVGAVLVHDGRIIGEGYHVRFGEAHAEVMAIRNCKQPELLSLATLYVNLEPCSHFGKTPPCADLILEHKIPRVVICNTDPFPQVAGRGIQKLRDAGVEVITGVLEAEGETLNRRFFTFHRKKRPYIILKWAQSADGFLNTVDKQPTKITGSLTDQRVHQWRTQEAGILVGYRTALIDNPRLTARLYPGKNPLRVVWDPKRELPRRLHLFSDGEPTLVFNNDREEKHGNIHYLRIENGNLKGLLDKLYHLQVSSLLVEGGAHTLNLFLEHKLWDEARQITGTLRINNGLAAPRLSSARLTHTQVSGDDTLHFFEPANSHSS